MIIKQVNTTVIDVFVGEGWENWTRFRKEGRKLVKIGGKQMEDADFSKLYRRIFH
jgi:hypothetical protein